MVDLAHAWGKAVDLDLGERGLRMFRKLGDGNEVIPASIIEWGEQMHDVERRRVGYDEVATPKGVIVKVSTVFLGFDHGIDRPEFFETMVFDGKERDLVARYTTWKEAERGHGVTVNRLKVGLSPS